MLHNRAVLVFTVFNNQPIIVPIIVGVMVIIIYLNIKYLLNENYYQYCQQY